MMRGTHITRGFDASRVRPDSDTSERRLVRRSVLFRAVSLSVCAVTSVCSPAVCVVRSLFVTPSLSRKSHGYRKHRHCQCTICLQCICQIEGVSVWCVYK